MDGAGRRELSVDSQADRAVLGPDAERFLETYALHPDARSPAASTRTTRRRAESGRSGAMNAGTVERRLAVLEAAAAQAAAARDARAQPARDEKLLVGLNGLAIDAFATSSARIRHSRGSCRCPARGRAYLDAGVERQERPAAATRFFTAACRAMASSTTTRCSAAGSSRCTEPAVTKSGCSGPRLWQMRSCSASTRTVTGCSHPLQRPRR